METFGEEFNDKVEPLSQGRDDWGYAYRPLTGGGGLSNHSSGTAADFNAMQHPYGMSGTFSRKQQRRIRRLLRKYRYAIRWGGEYDDEMHFEIDTNYAQVVRTLRGVKKKHIKTIELEKMRYRGFNKQIRAVKEAHEVKRTTTPLKHVQVLWTKL